MPLSKTEMQEELFKFLTLFGEQIADLYGASDSPCKEKKTIHDSPVWKAVMEMYDYGVMGLPTGDLFPGGRIDGVHAHIERFLRTMETPPMRIYLELMNNTPPRLAMRAVQSAVARMVLDGGDRYTDFGAGEYGIGRGDLGYLTLSEIALLANMDERSVRNAANPKLPDPLNTEPIGKRSLVNPEEARRWLAGRKGFVPTKECDRIAERPPEFNFELTKEQAELIQREASKTGLSFQKVLETVFSSAYERMQK